METGQCIPYKEMNKSGYKKHNPNSGNVGYLLVPGMYTLFTKGSICLKPAQ